MRSPIRLGWRKRLPFLLAVTASILSAAPRPYFSILSDDAGAWPAILSSIGLQRQPAAMANLFVARSGAPASADWTGRVEHGAILVLEGESSLANLFGFRRGSGHVKVSSLTDIHRQKLPIVWQRAEELPVFTIPAGAQVFTRERWTGAPMMAGLRRGQGAVLWIAADPGERGYERFPYLLEALRDLGMEPPFRSSRLWAFFDSAYRSRVDLDYFAQRWRKSGIAALHVAAWHFFEPDAENDRYLTSLIESCHREGILVYAWLELPHVSEAFWNSHPEWREKTALLQDAQLDWRKLMNLRNPECFRMAAAGVHRLAERFDWDGMNLAELYFESLEGAANPSRFTPMNDDIRREFQRQAGFDPLELFQGRRDAASLKTFLEFRAGLARRMQEEWLAEMEKIRVQKPDLDLVLTHVDDRLDTGMRDAIGADAAGVLPLLGRHSFTFLIEDPATVWNQGGQRYQAIAERYQALTDHRNSLAIDLNIVDRYQDVYPTKRQTGLELLQLVHSAAVHFPRVALYFEKSLLPPDLELLPAAAGGSARLEQVGPTTAVESAGGVGMVWKGGAAVDGQAWPATDGEVVWLPAGRHTIEAAAPPAGPHLVRLTADLTAARAAGPKALEFSYQSTSRAIAILDAPPQRIEIDGAPQAVHAAGPKSLLLPRGQHVVTITCQ